MRQEVGPKDCFSGPLTDVSPRLLEVSPRLLEVRSNKNLIKSTEHVQTKWAFHTSAMSEGAQWCQTSAFPKQLETQALREIH